jgi:hypothetical protein
VTTREALLDMLWQMLRASHDGSVTIRVPQGIAILQTNGRHLLVRVTDAELVTV